MTCAKALSTRISNRACRTTLRRLFGTWNASSGRMPRRLGSIQWMVGSKRSFAIGNTPLA